MDRYDDCNENRETMIRARQRIECYPENMRGRGMAGMANATQFKIPPQQNFDSEEMQGSMQQILSQQIGEYVVIEFLIGTERIMRKQGVLVHVGRSYVTLFDDMVNDYIVCDIFSVKFVYFYYPGQRPNRNYNLLPNVNNSGNGNMR
ncbi:MAG: hypothetical protein PUB00_03195 [Clostridiales bacterium]|nr:hypothetical protein [Clostridiales bacterium]